MAPKERNEGSTYALRLLAGIVLGTVFFIGGISWLHNILPYSPFRYFAGLFVGVLAVLSALALIRRMDREKA